jgi:two-component system, NarL family, nitrate/nitrite response regulator NarL
MNTPGHGGKAPPNVPIESEMLVIRIGLAHGSKKAGDDGLPIRAVVADDSPIILRTLCSFLKEQGNVQIIGAATDGCQAARRVLELKPDMLFINPRLYGTSGLELTSRSKACQHSPTVIIVVAGETPGCRAGIRTASTKGIVGQQLPFTRLPAAIRKVLPGARC